jgi:phosphonatase-like hydrolase
MTDIKMVVFDMAGTTVNEHNVVYKTLCKTINESGVEISLDTVLEHGAGKEKFQAIKDILKALHRDDIDVLSVFEEFKIQLDEAYNNLEVTSIEGVEEVVQNLKNQNIKVVLNTGYNSAVANHLLTKMSWHEGEHYDALVTADDVEKGRPYPDMIIKAMEIFDIDNAKYVLKAGDSAIDIEEGKNANCGITVGVLSGAQTRAQLETVNPDYILDSLASLTSII